MQPTGLSGVSRWDSSVRLERQPYKLKAGGSNPPPTTEVSMSGRHWKPQELQRLLTETGVTGPQLAQILGRSLRAVYGQLLSLGIRLKPTRESIERVIRQNVECGFKDQVSADQLNISLRCIRKHRVRMCLKSGMSFHDRQVNAGKARASVADRRKGAYLPGWHKLANNSTYQGYVRGIARTYAKSDENKYEELEAIGMLGLVIAAKAFDPKKSSNFGGYMYARVVWAIQGAFRMEDPLGFRRGRRTHPDRPKIGSLPKNL